jgi:hypothetical protein
LYQPIALLETLLKLLEKIIVKWFTIMSRKLGIVTLEQFGGKDKSSCLDTGLSMLHNVHMTHAQKKSASITLMDISGYFNNIDHNMLMHITAKLGFPHKYTEWL